MRYWRRIVAVIIALRIRTGRENRGRVGRGGISSLVSNSHREHLLRPSSAILISNIDNNPENNGISQGTCIPRLLQPDGFFQSSETSNSWRMLCVMSKQFSRKFKTMTAQKMQYLSPTFSLLLMNLSCSSIL